MEELGIWDDEVRLRTVGVRVNIRAPRNHAIVRTSSNRHRALSTKAFKLALTSPEISNAFTSFTLSSSSPSTRTRKCPVVSELLASGIFVGVSSAEPGLRTAMSVKTKNSETREMCRRTMSRAIVRTCDGLRREEDVPARRYFPSMCAFAIRQKFGRVDIIDSESDLTMSTIACHTS